MTRNLKKVSHEWANWITENTTPPHLSLLPKFSSFVSIYEWAAYAAFSILKQFYLHILWNGEDTS